MSGKLSVNRCGKAQKLEGLRAPKPNSPVYYSRLHTPLRRRTPSNICAEEEIYAEAAVTGHRNVNFKAFLVRIPNFYLAVVMDEDFLAAGRGQVPAQEQSSVLILHAMKCFFFIITYYKSKVIDTQINYIHH